MKLFLKTLAFSLFTVPLVLSAQSGEINLDNPCHGGGWWMPLISGYSNLTARGGIYPSTGAYKGCGTVEACRVDLTRQIETTIEERTKSCTSRGGEVRSSSNGNWVEKMYGDWWDIRSEGVGIVCEKWISCD